MSFLSFFVGFCVGGIVGLVGFALLNAGACADCIQRTHEEWRKLYRELSHETEPK